MKAWLVLLCILVSCGLGIGLSLPPTGYLHSWNQISTLAASRSILTAPSSWYQTRDVVTRVTWEKPGEQIDASDREKRFIVYEEFPLYHVLLATISTLGFSLEASGRVLSLVFFFLGGVGLYYVARSILPESVSTFSVLLYLTSFPFLYYGQAIMSDIAMVTCAIWGVCFLRNWEERGRNAWLVAALSLFALSGLFKSYGIVLLGIPLVSIGRTKGVQRALFYSVLAVAPVLAWHVFALGQVGHQEFVSHSLNAKFDMLSSSRLYASLFKVYFRYLGYIAGAVLLLYGATRLMGRIRADGTVSLPLWVPTWLVISVLYGLLTVDKLPDHDYYFLLVFPPRTAKSVISKAPIP